MADEIDHAERAFALASAYKNSPAGPGPLDVRGALSVPTAKSFLATLLREGCIGETLAAVEAAEAHERAIDPSVRETLAIIAHDETTHAALACRAARWVLENHDPELTAWFADEYDRAIADRAAIKRSTSIEDPDLAAHGIVSHDRRLEIHRFAIAEIVAPQIRALVSHATHAQGPAINVALEIAG
jgi:hypothetical protein